VDDWYADWNEMLIWTSFFKLVRYNCILLRNVGFYLKECAVSQSRISAVKNIKIYKIFQSETKP